MHRDVEKQKRISSRCSLYCAVCPSIPALWGAHTFTHVYTLYCIQLLWASRMQGKKRKALLLSTPRCLPAVRAMAYILACKGKKMPVQQTVRICEGWEEMEERRTGKGEEWEKQKDLIQDEIDRASEKTEQGERGLFWVSQAPVAQFSRTRSGHNEKSRTTVLTSLCGCCRCFWWRACAQITLLEMKSQNRGNFSPQVLDPLWTCSDSVKWGNCGVNYRKWSSCHRLAKRPGINSVR